MICICTSIWTHHQAPLARELAKLLGSDKFRLLLHQPLDHRYSIERIKMGWNLVPPDEEWIIGPPKCSSNVDYSEYLRIVMESDAIIFSSDTPFLTQSVLEARHRAGKLNFRMGERMFKVPRPWYWRLWPRKWLARWIMGRRFRRAGLHFLTMGHGCFADLKYYNASSNRIWRWGYLTDVSSECRQKPKRERIHIGWCGRMIDWKHVDYIIKALGMLPREILSKCEVSLIGDGDQEDDLKKLMHENGLDDCITFKSSMASSEILKFMQDLDVYIFPSDRKEGWGAALLEAMDKGCAVIANAAAGSTLEVVEDGVNGFVFDDGDIMTLAERIVCLVKNDDLRWDMGRKAWKTIQQWSPHVGAERLVGLIQAIKKGEYTNSFTSGLCNRVDL